MARSHARIQTAIWGDRDFKARSGPAQLAYFMLTSQPDLGHSGLLSLTVRRWAGLSANGTKESIWEAITELADTDFVVVDEDTEELLIRSLVRNDNAWKQPKVLAVAIAEAARISSPKLRARFCDEMKRIDPSELPDKTREDVEALLKELPESLANAHLELPHEAPADPPPEGDAHPPEQDPARPPREGGTEGDRGTRARGRSPQPLPQSPAPAIPPTATDAVASMGGGLFLVGADESQGAEKKPRKSRRKADASPEDDLAHELVKGFWDLYSKTNAQSWIAIRQVVVTALKNGVPRNDLAHAMNALGKQGKPISGGHLTTAIGELSNKRTGASGKYAVGSGSEVPARDAYDPENFV